MLAKIGRNTATRGRVDPRPSENDQPERWRWLLYGRAVGTKPVSRGIKKALVLNGVRMEAVL